MYISVVLENLYGKGLLRSKKWAQLPSPSYCKEQSHFRYTMELVETVVTPEERTFLEGKDAEKEVLHETTRKIQDRCMEQMLLYEGSDPDIEKQMVSRKKKRPFKGTVIAVGPRVRNYKAELKSLLGMTTAGYPPLQDRPQEQTTQGTPPGNYSIARFFARNG